MTDRERLVAEIDADLKARVKADPRTIREIVEAALNREFMTGATAAVERRIDEQKARITQLEQERNERDRELAEAKDTLQRLQSQLDAHEEQETQKWDEARDAFENIDDEKLTADNPAVENWAEKLGVTPSELLDEVR